MEKRRLEEKEMNYHTILYHIATHYITSHCDMMLWYGDVIISQHRICPAPLCYARLYVRTLATMPTASKRRRSRSFLNVGRPMSKYPVTPWRDEVWRKKWWNCRMMRWVRIEAKREKEREKEKKKRRSVWFVEVQLLRS